MAQCQWQQTHSTLPSRDTCHVIPESELAVPDSRKGGVAIRLPEFEIQQDASDRNQQQHQFKHCCCLTFVSNNVSIVVTLIVVRFY